MDEISNGPITGGHGSGSGWRRYGGAAALVAGGLVAGGVLAGTLSATAASPSPSPSTQQQAPSYSGPRGEGDQSKSRRSDERLLTGTTASKVRAAALAKYPGATVHRVETDADGVYEVHLVTSAGQRLTVQVGKDFTVTGTETRNGGCGGHGGRGMRSAPNGTTSPESGTSSGGAGWYDGGESGGTGGQAA